MYFCNVYAWILIKYQLHFDFLVVFTLLVRPCQLLYHVSWLLYYWSLHFFFFVLTSGRPLRVITSFVFSKPLCGHFAAQIVIPEFSAPLQKCCLSLSKGFPLQRETAKICYCCSQPFYSSFVALLEVILQRCSSATRFVRAPFFVMQHTKHSIKKDRTYWDYYIMTISLTCIIAHLITVRN